MQAIHVQFFFLSEVLMIFNLSLILAEFFYAFTSINKERERNVCCFIGKRHIYTVASGSMGHSAVIFSLNTMSMWMHMKVKVAQSCLTLCDPVDCSLPGVKLPKLIGTGRWLLRVLWTARRSNQSILQESSPKHSLEGLMLKLQYFDHLARRADSLEKTLMLGGIGGRRRRGW